MENSFSRTDKKILSLDNVCKAFKTGAEKTVILQDLSAQFACGRSYSLEGVSGTGKSTLIYLLAGLDVPTSGQVLYNGVSFAALSADEREIYLKKELGLVFQFPYLMYELSVLENVMLKGLLDSTKTKDVQERALLLLEQVGLYEKRDSTPAVLSGGEQQRIALARALLNDPAFLLADEPTAHVDSKTRDVIMNMILDRMQAGMGIILTSHDPEVSSLMQVRYQLRDKSSIQIG